MDWQPRGADSDVTDLSARCTTVMKQMEPALLLLIPEHKHQSAEANFEQWLLPSYDVLHFSGV